MSTTTAPLSAEQIAERLAAQRARAAEGGASSTPTPPPVHSPLDEVRATVLRSSVPTVSKDYRFVRPLAGSADEGLIETVQNSEGRFMFGLTELDTRIRGVGPGEFCLIVGFAHSGKTQLVLQAILNNPDAHVLIFTPDEVSELVLMKLVCMKHGLNAEDLERRLKAGDPEAETLVRRAARVDFRNLIVIDQPLSLADMTQAVEEAEDFWGAEAQAIVLDYLNLFRTGADDVEGKSEALKDWTKVIRRPVLCLHQAGRGAAGKGEPITMTSGKYGGEQEAIFLIGVRRRRDDESLDEWERRQHENTVSLSVVKNKRPPSRKTPVEGIDHYLDPTSGVIRMLRSSDFTGAVATTYTKPEQALDARVHPDQLEAF